MLDSMWKWVGSLQDEVQDNAYMECVKCAEGYVLVKSSSGAYDGDDDYEDTFGSSEGGFKGIANKMSKMSDMTEQDIRDTMSSSSSSDDDFYKDRCVRNSSYFGYVNDDYEPFRAS